MNGPVNPIDNLRDIHLPLDPDWWPPAVGWWIVAVVFLLLTYRIAVGVTRWHRHASELREFRKQVQAIPVEGLTTAEDKQSAVASLSALVKQLCIHVLGRRTVAAIHGKAWLKLLDNITTCDQFTKGPGQLLATGAYRQNSSGDVVALKELLLDKLTRRSVLRTARGVKDDER